MLRKIRSKKIRSANGRFAIVAAEYNGEYVNSMLRAARATLAAGGAAAVRVVRVPGAFEVPVAAAALARQKNPPWAGIICLGVIFRGETTHAQHIGEAVTLALSQLAVETEVPMIHEVLLLENRAQADKRCLDPRHNRGAEAAQTALAMSGTMSRLRA